VAAALALAAAAALISVGRVCAEEVTAVATTYYIRSYTRAPHKDAIKCVCVISPRWAHITGRTGRTDTGVLPGGQLKAVCASVLHTAAPTTPLRRCVRVCVRARARGCAVSVRRVCGECTAGVMVCVCVCVRTGRRVGVVGRSLYRC